MRLDQSIKERRSIVISVCSLIFIGLTLSLVSSTGLATPSETPEESVKRIAVLRLIDRLGISREEIDYLTDIARRTTSKQLEDSQFLVMTQENIMVLLPADVQLDECDGECQIETGRRLGVKYLISGELLRFGTSLRLTLKLYDTHSGRLISSEISKAKEIDSLESPTERAMVSLLVPIQSLHPKKSTSRPQVTAPSPVLSVGPQGGSSSSATQRQGAPKYNNEASRKPKPEEATERSRAQVKTMGSAQALQSQRAHPAISKGEESSRLKKSKKEYRDPLGDIGFELSFGGAKSACEDKSNEMCQSFTSSGRALDFGLSFTLTPPRGFVSWIASFDMRFSQNQQESLSGSSEFRNAKFSTWTIGTLAGFKFWRFYFRGNLGVGWISGEYKERQLGSTFEFSEMNGYVAGLDFALRLTKTWMISAYLQRSGAIFDVETCSSVGDRCRDFDLPSLTQTGARISLTF